MLTLLKLRRLRHLTFLTTTPTTTTSWRLAELCTRVEHKTTEKDNNKNMEENMEENMTEEIPLDTPPNMQNTHKTQNRKILENMLIRIEERDEMMKKQEEEILEWSKIAKRNENVMAEYKRLKDREYTEKVELIIRRIIEFNKKSNKSTTNHEHEQEEHEQEEEEEEEEVYANYRYKMKEYEYNIYDELSEDILHMNIKNDEKENMLLLSCENIGNEYDEMKEEMYFVKELLKENLAKTNNDRVLLLLQKENEEFLNQVFNEWLHNILLSSYKHILEYKINLLHYISNIINKNETQTQTQNENNNDNTKNDIPMKMNEEDILQIIKKYNDILFNDHLIDCVYSQCSTLHYHGSTITFHTSYHSQIHLFIKRNLLLCWHIILSQSNYHFIFNQHNSNHSTFNLSPNTSKYFL